MSKTISISIPHKLTQDEARSRIQKGLADLKRQHAGKISELHEDWNGNQLNFRVAAMGQKVTGRVDVQSDAVKLDVDLPFLLAMLAGKIRPQVEAEGRKLLS